MTAPRKPVAWTDQRGLERLMDGKQELVSGKPTSADDSVALYTAPNLQPLWALVDKYGQWSDERQAKADRHNENGDAAAAEFDSGMAEAYSRVADELKSALEATQ